MNKRQAREQFFDWSDAWVFAALSGSYDASEILKFPQFLVCGDVLNHAILTSTEIRQGLVKLHQRGLVHVARRRVRVLPLTEELHSKIRTMRGGLFSVIDNTLKVLNSPRTVLPIVVRAPNVDFITDDFVLKATRRMSSTH